MLRLLWFLIKIGLLVAGAVWIAARPGSVDIQWMDYDISIHFGFFLLVFFILILLAIGLTRFSLYFASLPGRYKDRKSIGNAEKGLNSLTLSLSSAAAGDYGHAQFHAERALKMLPGHQPLPLLLQAGAQRKQGQFEKADATLKSLLSHPEGAVLAARALINNAVEQNNISGALTYARTAERDYKGKDRGWLLQTLYELEAKTGNWDAAEVNLNKALKKKAISKEKSVQDYIAIATSKAKALTDKQENAAAAKILKAVLRKNPGFVPAIETLYNIYSAQGKARSAANLIKKGWVHGPHPVLLTLWTKSAKDFNKSDTDLIWLKKLIKTNPKHVESDFALAKAHFAVEEYEAAKTALEQAVEKEPQRRFFKLWADLAQKMGQSEASVRHRLEQMTEAKADPVWICSKTGTIYDAWSAIAMPHGAFNTIIWARPDTIRQAANMNEDRQMYDYLIASS